jgi:DNA-binding response OmpR family regulator
VVEDEEHIAEVVENHLERAGNMVVRAATSDEDARHPRLILTVYGRGYVLAEDAS